MKWHTLSRMLLPTFMGIALSRDVPPSLASLYDTLTSRPCATPLATGFYATDSGPPKFTYCGDLLPSLNALYITGPNGALADMDVDCDGITGGPGDDGRCSIGRSPDYQDQTAFRDTVRSLSQSNISDLNTYVHPYVVFGNTGAKKGWKTFDPTKYGVKPLSLVAVVCGEKLVYGVWGDTNGDDGTKSMVGEVSLALATACEGEGMNGGNGHSETDVLYLVFGGDEAVPRGAEWGAQSYKDFEGSLGGLGDGLVKRVEDVDLKWNFSLSHSFINTIDMKTAIVASLAGAATATTQMAALPYCGQICINNMLALAPALGCPGSDPSCLCSKPDFGFGVRDCADQACHPDDAALVHAYGFNYCAQVEPPVVLEPGPVIVSVPPAISALESDPAAPSPTADVTVKQAAVVSTYTSGSETFITTLASSLADITGTITTYVQVESNITMTRLTTTSLRDAEASDASTSTLTSTSTLPTPTRDTGSIATVAVELVAGAAGFAAMMLL
ncbi:hypothetical protein OQA88_7634 [Cercophora sp. LCS_1]